MLHDTTIVITGATRGLGKVIAETCWGHGASLLLVARSTAALAARRAELASTARAGQTVEVCAADLAIDGAADAIVAAARRAFPAVHGLVNNAGILGPVGKAWDNDWQAWQAAIRVNLLAPVELCRAFAPWMIERGGGSIVNLSGGGATGPRPNFSAYATAKTGLVRFTEVLAHELHGTGVRANAIAPGAMATEMLAEIVAAGRDQVGAAEYDKVVELAQAGGTPPARAAALTAFLCTDGAKGITGRLLAAAWDPWDVLDQDALQASDLYTLRRIVPEDRGKKW